MVKNLEIDIQYLIKVVLVVVNVGNIQILTKNFHVEIVILNFALNADKAIILLEIIIVIYVE